LFFLLPGCRVALSIAAFIVISGPLAFFPGNTDGLVQQMPGAFIVFTPVPVGFLSFVPLQLLHCGRLLWHAEFILAAMPLERVSGVPCCVGMACL
jgi:hypothetical protein